MSLKPVSTNIDQQNSYPKVSEKGKKTLLAALSVICFIGAVLGGLGFANYLPFIATLTGGSLFITSTVAIVAITIYRKMRNSSGENKSASSNLPHLNDGQSLPQNLDYIKSRASSEEEIIVPNVKGPDVKVKEVQDIYWTQMVNWDSSAELPTEIFLKELANSLLAFEPSPTDKINPQLIKECALACPAFRKDLLAINCLWKPICENPHFIIEIAQKDPNFALEIIILSKWQDIKSQETHLQLFQISHPLIIDAIKNDILAVQNGKPRILKNNNNLPKDTCHNFLVFLLNLRKIQPDDFVKVQEITSAIQARKDDSAPRNKANIFTSSNAFFQNYSFTSYLKVMNLIEGRLYFELGNGALPTPPEISNESIEYFFSSQFHHYKMINYKGVEAPLQKSINFLTSIPRTDCNYHHAQCALGKIWMKLEHFDKASKAFNCAFTKSLQLENASFVKENTILYARCTFMIKIHKINGSKEFILRQQSEKYDAHDFQIRELESNEYEDINSVEAIEQVYAALNKPLRQ